MGSGEPDAPPNEESPDSVLPVSKDVPATTSAIRPKPPNSVLPVSKDVPTITSDIRPKPLHEESPVLPTSKGVPANPSIRKQRANPVRPIEADRSDQRYSIALSLLDFVMADRDKAIFEAHHATDTDENQPPYRATVFWPVLVAAEERLYPMVRASYGASARRCHSPLYFLKSDTEQYAGAAWFWLGRALMEANLPALGHDGNLDVWRDKWQSRGVPKRIAAVMGGRSQSYLTHVRSIACIGFDTTYGNMVLCIESTRPMGFAKACLTSRGGEGTVPKLLEINVVDRVRDHSDFWTWVLNTTWPWVTAAVTIASGAGWLHEKGVTDGAQHWLVVVAPFIPPATLAVVGLAFFPVQKVAAESSHFEERLQRFCSHWQHFWLLVIASYLWVSLRVGREITSELEERLWNVAITVVLLFAVDSLFGCYACLTRFSHDERASAGKVPHVRPYGRFLVFALGLPLISSQIVSTIPPGIAGIALAVALCLLVGRLDSPLIGTPATVIAGLYLNAVLMPLSCFLSCAANSQKVKAVIPYVELATTISRGLSVVLTVALFITVGWLIQGRAFERYLFNLEPVSLAVPRRTLIEAMKKLRERRKKRASKAD
jgi:hypothetical protein